MALTSKATGKQKKLKKLKKEKGVKPKKGGMRYFRPGTVKAAAPAAPAVKKAHKWRPGTVALRQIKKLQKGTDTLLQRAKFARMMRESINRRVTAPGGDDGQMRMTAGAVSALHEATEAYMVSTFANANLCALHAKRVTVMPRDLHLARRLAGDRF